MKYLVIQTFSIDLGDGDIERETRPVPCNTTQEVHDAIQAARGGDNDWCIFEWNGAQFEQRAVKFLYDTPANRQQGRSHDVAVV